ncbi:MAG TPA: hypothetical protein VJ865_11335, partial [Gemmatimonadaceae bacterium]|nr:hypothetical protein [Gemmatimonadaceae bacterium]
MTKSYGGAFLPNRDYDISGDIDFSGAVNLDSATLTSPAINGTPTGTAFKDRTIKTSQQAVLGDALHAGNLNWQNPESAGIIILRVILNIVTPSTGASTIDVGVTATSATTSSDTLLDGVSGTPAAIFDSMNAALDSGANAKAQTVAVGKWITLDEASGDTSGMV